VIACIPDRGKFLRVKDALGSLLWPHSAHVPFHDAALSGVAGTVSGPTAWYFGDHGENMERGALRRFAIVAAMVVASQANGQTIPLSRTVPVTFSGVISSTAADTLLVRQPDGSFASFQGELPALSYAKGDPVTISFNATLPTRAFYDSAVYRGQIAADGIYKISLANPYYTGATIGGIGNSTIAEVSGPISPALNSGQPTNTRMTIVYDYNADSYSIEGGGNFVSGAYTSPGYLYDATTRTYVACGSGVSCSPSGATDPILSSFSSGQANVASTIRSGNFAVASTDPSSGAGTGLFSWIFEGSWNLPQYQGGPTQVPEPGMVTLFGAACLFLACSRRRKGHAGPGLH
jgi:hypothetical protein